MTNHRPTRIYRKRVNSLPENCEENKAVIREAGELEAEDQNRAFAAYREMMAKRKKVTNRDALLYHRG
jgi:hypothetical protein